MNDEKKFLRALFISAMMANPLYQNSVYELLHAQADEYVDLFLEFEEHIEWAKRQGLK